MLIFYYLIIINVITFIIYYLDKKKSIKHKYRISEKTLLLLSIFGGSVGGISAMYLFRHKTKKWYFKVTNIVSLIIWIFIFIYIY